MVFSSTIFLVLFLPAFLWLYALAPRNYKNMLLLAASILFYSWGAPQFLFAVLGLSTATYFLVNFIDRATSIVVKRTLLSLAIAINVGVLFYYKYLTFLIDNVNGALAATGVFGPIEIADLVLPIGISFYTFETVTYVVDVYRGVHRPLDRYWLYLLYILMFPKLIAGPIVRFHEIADQFNDRFDNNNAFDRLVGLHRFCLGLGKKVLIANTLGTFVDAVYGDAQTGAGGISPETVDRTTAWLAAVCYSMQIYFDFSGYSDMAIGLGRFMGFRLPENFNSPYVSSSITEFWRRWHITLGAWMRNYLYIPLGGNRVSQGRTYLNLWIVFLLSGLWHGASWNFVIWGAWHGLFLVLERLGSKSSLKIPYPVSMALTYLAVLFGWVFFRVENLNLATMYCQNMLGWGGGSASLALTDATAVTLYLALALSVLCGSQHGERFTNWVFEDAVHSFAGRCFMTVSSVVLFVLALSKLAAAEFNPFIYFRF